MSDLTGTSEPEPPRLRVLLVHECPAQRQRFRDELGPLDFAEIVGEAHHDREALDLVFRLRPDVVVLSTCLPGQGGFEVLRCIKRACGNCHVILTAPRLSPFLEEAAHLLGATGVCPVTDGLVQLCDLLQDLAAS